jgi:hypothetical protein
LKQQLAAFIKTVPGGTVVVEDWERVFHREEGQPPGAAKAPDLAVCIIDTTNVPWPEELALGIERKSSYCLNFKIDLTVRDVHATSCRKAILEQGCAMSAEVEKKGKYTVYEEDTGFVVIPFGISSSGEVGPQAMLLLDLMCRIAKGNGKTLLKTEFVKKMSLNIETMRCFMIREYETQIQRALSSRPSSVRERNSSLPLKPPGSLSLKDRKRWSQQQNAFWSTLHPLFNETTRLQTQSSREDEASSSSSTSLPPVLSKCQLELQKQQEELLNYMTEIPLHLS